MTGWREWAVVKSSQQATVREAKALNISTHSSLQEQQSLRISSQLRIPLAVTCGQPRQGSLLGESAHQNNVSFFQAENVDLVLIGTSTDVQGHGEKLLGTRLTLPWAVAPCLGIIAPPGPAVVSFCWEDA